MKSHFLQTSKEKWFLEMEAIPGEDAGMIVERTTKDLGYYINLVDKTVAGFESFGSSFEKSSTVCKMLSNSIAWYREIICEKKNQPVEQTSPLS